MKKLLIIITLNLGSTAVSAGNYSKDYEFPNKDCQEMFSGIGELLEEADKEWVYLKNNTDSSSGALEHAAKIQWYLDLAVNYTTIFEAFCDKD